MSTIHGLPISTHAIICSKCTSLISKLVTCQNCSDTIPVISTFSPDIFLSRKCNAGLATSADVAALRAHLASAKQLLKTYDFLLDTLEKSANQVDGLVKYYSTCIKRAFKTLPPEILSLVFQFAAAGRYNAVYTSGDAVETDSPSIVISQVCQNWRHIALRTPALWREISLQAPTEWISTSVENRVARKEIFALYIQRAQSTQLNIKFGIHRLAEFDIRFDDFESEFQIMCKALGSYWDRVSSLHIYFRPPTGLTLPLLHLEELTVNGYQTPRCYDDLGFNTPGALPALRKLVVPTFPGNINLSPSALGITSLTIKSTSRETFSSSMSWWNRVPNLEVLILDWPDENDCHPPGPLQSLKLPNLQHLELPSRGMHVQAMTDFKGLDLFDVPKLQSLVIYSSHRHHSLNNDSVESSDVVDPYRLSEFFGRSPLCSSLVLEEAAISPARLLKILTKLANLRELKLRRMFYACKAPRSISEGISETLGVTQYRSSIGNQFFAMLSDVDAESIPLHLPNLQRLDIEAPSTGLDSKVVLQFLHVRLEGRRSLTHAEILFQYQPLSKSLVRELEVVTRRFREENRDSTLMITHQVPKTTFRVGGYSGAPITRRVV
ncbi:hypothetical protein DL96DRAFT_1623515 [Flagelloscypha sp. PMI_526]|nr:hypothetical protein DL96DRAFT_1623515 [Flagelloscypha sp. PMI_526]